ncbi:hypothetical protein DFH11DRAFT_1748413 [Phellopilus nigrolimitatus]|nr:hypothetical protein DFH11DRAFT_1748413 [Phellopilus nigrolimitatus]
MRVQKARGSSHQPPATIISSTMDLDYGFPQTPPATPRPQTLSLPPCDGEQQLPCPQLSHRHQQNSSTMAGTASASDSFSRLCVNRWDTQQHEWRIAMGISVHGTMTMSLLPPAGKTQCPPCKTIVTSITSAEILLQRITSELDIGPSPQDDALLSIREKVVHLFLDIWDPHQSTAIVSLGSTSSSSRLVHSLRVMKPSPAPRPYEEGDRRRKTLGEMFRAHIVASHDIADAAELLFEHRWSNGYVIGLNTLLSAAGDEICRYAAQPRILTLAQHWKISKSSMGYWAYRWNTSSGRVLTSQRTVNAVQKTPRLED